MIATKTSTAYGSQVGEEVGQRDGTERAPDTSAEKIPTKITALVDGLTFGTAVRLRGEIIDLTPELVQQSRDRDGNSFLTLDEDAQIRRWGQVMFKPGDHAAEIKAADDQRRAAQVQARARAADPGMLALLDVW